jgi:hypothetical protein
VGDGATPTPVTAVFAPGARVSGYLLEEQIGRGGMAVVFRALDERLNRQVALKVMAPGQAVDDAFRRRFVMESQAAAAVDDPHIIPVYEAGEADGVLFIAMRLVRGGNLKTLVQRHGPLSPARAGWIVADIASALDAAHARGLVHRDVKPANMLLDVRPGRPDHVYLSDFGVSKAALEPSGLTGSGQFLGTVDYAAPEQIQGKAVDGRTDQYALGCAAYELLCGRPPFAGRELLAAMYAQLSERAPAPSSVCTGLPAAADEVFAQVLAKSPDDRYESCQDFARALATALGVRHFEDDRPGEAALGTAPEGGSGDDATLDPALARGQSAPAGAANGVASSDASLTFEPPSSGDTIPGAGPGGGGLWDGAGTRTRSFRSARRVLATVVAVVVVLAAVVAWVLLMGRPAAASPIRFRNGYGTLAVSQVWQLEGKRGTVLDVTIKAFNASGKPVAAQLEEPIPKLVASNLKKVRFTGQPQMVLARSVVVWKLNLPGKGHVSVGYRVPEPPAGATEVRLRGFVDAFKSVAGQQDLERVTSKAVLKYLVISPDTIQLHVSGSYRLTLSGLTSHTVRASARELSKAVWRSDNTSVARVFHGLVVAKGLGQTRITAKIGAITAYATVLVVTSGQPGPVYGYTPPAVSPSPSTSTPGFRSVPPSPTSTTGSPSPTPTTGSPSPTPTTGSPSPGS